MNPMHYNIDKYLYIYAYCLWDVGKKRISIYDSMEDKIHLLDISYYRYIKLFRKKKLSDLYAIFKEEATDIDELIDFLLKNKLARCVDNISLFPTISIEWDSPYNVKKTLIDIRNKFHDFKDIFSQLTALKCYSVEVRFYREVTCQDVLRIAEALSFEIIQQIILIIPYQEQYKTNDFYTQINDVVKRDRRFSFFFYNTPADSIQSSQEFLNNIFPDLSITTSFSGKKISGCESCGVIDYRDFYAISTEQYMENRLFNNCLNRQISIDEDGEIKNCPSMCVSWGNITSTQLKQVYDLLEFRDLWTITKDKIRVCKQCELRHLCPDCRAYIEFPEDIYSKPKKCNYDPMQIM